MAYNVVILESAQYEYEAIVRYLAQILMNPRAAGVTMKGSAHDVINNLLRQITLQLKEA